MKKYVVEFYHHWGVCNAQSYLVAENEEEAEELHYMLFLPEHRKFVEPESIYEWCDEIHFLTREECEDRQRKEIEAANKIRNGIKI